MFQVTIRTPPYVLNVLNALALFNMDLLGLRKPDQAGSGAMHQQEIAIVTS